MAIPPQLAHTIKGRGGSEDSSFNQPIVWANYIWMQDSENPPPPWAKPEQNTPNNPSEMRESAQTRGTHTEKYKPWTNSLPLNVSTQTLTRAHTHTHSSLVHYPYTLLSPAGSYRSFVSLTCSHTHILTQMWHSALDQISACSSQKRWGGLRGLRLNRKHREEPFPNAPPKSQSTPSLAPPTTSARLHLQPEVRGLGSVRCGLLKLHVRRWCFGVFGCFLGVGVREYIQLDWYGFPPVWWALQWMLVFETKRAKTEKKCVAVMAYTRKCRYKHSKWL